MVNRLTKGTSNEYFDCIKKSLLNRKLTTLLTVFSLALSVVLLGMKKLGLVLNRVLNQLFLVLI